MKDHRRKIVPPSGDDPLENEIARIRLLTKDRLRQLWQRQHGFSAPRALSKDMLGRACAWQVQEKAKGGVDLPSQGLLARHGSKPGKGDARRHLMLGAVLIREHQGHRHIVTVVAGGYSWGGNTYKSLTAIARAITGTPWNGPRFFGLRRLKPEPLATQPSAECRSE